MLSKSYLVLVSLAIIAADFPKADKAEKKDEELIQGTWTIQSMIHGGKAAPKENFSASKHTFQDDKLINVECEDMLVFSFKLDATKKPKQINMEFNGMKGAGIYELDGDTLKICHGEWDGERPKEFKSAEGSKDTLTILKREKK